MINITIMKNLLLFLILLISCSAYSQISLNYTPPNDIGLGISRVVTYPNVGSYNGLSLDMVVCPVSYYSSDPSDTSWYNNTKFKAVNGKFSIEVPYFDTLTRCVSLQFKLVESGTNNCVNTNIDNTFYDLDSSRLKDESLTFSNYNSFSLYNPTSLDYNISNSEISFTSSDKFNNPSLSGALDVSYTNTCTFNIDFCCKANNQGGFFDFLLNTVIDTIFIMDINKIGFNNFAVVTHECSSLISWDVDSQQIVKRYVIQHSLDGLLFEDVLNIAPSDDEHYAHYLGVWKKQNYYRVKIIYNDNSIEYSKIIASNNACETAYETITPNPFVDKINITSKDKFYNISIFNIHGELIKSYDCNTTSIDLDLSDISSNLLLIKVTYTSGHSNISKIVKYL